MTADSKNQYEDVYMENLVSIIVPVYNGEKYIETLVKSIENQTYKNYEVLIVNDGSTDRTEEICLRLKKNNSHIHYSYQNNSGPGAARNMGIEKSTGDYVLFIDCDDYIHPSYIQYLYELMKKCNVDIACCSYYKGDVNDIEGFLTLQDKGIYKIFSQPDALASMFYRKEIMGYPYCKLLKRSVLQGIAFDNTLRLGEDFKFVYDLLCRAEKVAFLDKRLYFYYQNNEGITHTLTQLDIWKVWRMIRDKMFLPAWSEEIQRAILSKLFIMALDTLRMLNDTMTETDAVFTEELYDFIKQNRVKILKDASCKISNRILGGLCCISIAGTVRCCRTGLKLMRKLKFPIRKAI